EMQRPAAGAGVAIELRRHLAAGQEHVGEAVAVAVEGRHPAADHVLPAAGVDAVDPGARCLLNEARNERRRFGCGSLDGSSDGKDQRRKRENDRDLPDESGTRSGPPRLPSPLRGRDGERGTTPPSPQRQDTRSEVGGEPISLSLPRKGRKEGKD